MMTAKRPTLYPVSPDDGVTAVFTDYASARAAADAALPRRKHRRPYVQPSGYHWRLLGRDAWIVLAEPNLVLRCDGTMG
jgi:hypothetical protein